MKFRSPIVYSSEEEKRRVVEIGGTIASWIGGLAAPVWILLYPEKFRALLAVFFGP